MDDVDALTARNERFIDACREGSWEQLRVVLGSDFRYLDGRTGEMWDEERYRADLRENPAPSLTIDEVAIHIAGDTATVSARTWSATRPGRANRYLDTYARRDGQWVCVHACVWPLPEQAAVR
ncbi:MAG TPA: nuclear transport factor 2 family protein [Jatrophihabitans sp.]|nr:nuclear transport factor 2 family protein [Jatrophihabitans sp.]